MSHYYTAYTRSYLRYSAQEVNVTITGDVAALVAQLDRPAHLQRLQNATSEQFPPTTSIAVQQAAAARPCATNGTALPQHLSSTGATCTNQHQQICSQGGTYVSCMVAVTAVV